MSDLTPEAIREMVEKANNEGLAVRSRWQAEYFLHEAAPDIAAQALRWHDELTAAEAEIERLKGLLGDPDGTIAHADAITAYRDNELTAARARIAALDGAFRCVDDQDWEYLLSQIGHGGRDRFWREVLSDARAVLHEAGDAGGGGG